MVREAWLLCDRRWLQWRGRSTGHRHRGRQRSADSRLISLCRSAGKHQHSRLDPRERVGCARLQQRDHGTGRAAVGDLRSGSRRLAVRVTVRRLAWWSTATRPVGEPAPDREQHARPGLGDAGVTRPACRRLITRGTRMVVERTPCRAVCSAVVKPRTLMSWSATASHIPVLRVQTTDQDRSARAVQRGHGGAWIRYDTPRSGDGECRKVDTLPSLRDERPRRKRALT